MRSRPHDGLLGPLRPSPLARLRRKGSPDVFFVSNLVPVSYFDVWRLPKGNDEFGGIPCYWSKVDSKKV